MAAGRGLSFPALKDLDLRYDPSCHYEEDEYEVDLVASLVESLRAARVTVVITTFPERDCCC
jgi:hypothetical protein